MNSNDHHPNNQLSESSPLLVSARDNDLVGNKHRERRWVPLVAMTVLLAWILGIAGFTMMGQNPFFSSVSMHEVGRPTKDEFITSDGKASKSGGMMFKKNSKASKTAAGTTKSSKASNIHKHTETASPNRKKKTKQKEWDVSTTQAVAGLQLPGYPSPEIQLQYEQDLMEMDWKALEQDLEELMTKSQDSYWPADYGHYGPMFIRLAWHSCGSYRTSDGRGGCDGGAQRFDPERSWPDNTNLDKARRLLEPIKEKYGNGLSWGDLFAFVGTIAIKSMGGPFLGFCAGRIDVIDNSQTLALGPTPEQDKFAHCEVNGMCPYPLGSNTLGLIYVNPEGPMGNPDPQGAADTIRDVFGRMDWDGREVVALIGGGHTFGKAHGASLASPGEPPNTCPFAPWNGPKGVDAITSGFEGPWTSNPTKWDNKYFRYLVDYEWEPHKGPGGHWQWRINGTDDAPVAPVADPHSDDVQPVMMLTTDVALSVDPEYRQYVEEFAEDEEAFTEAFAKAWYKLVTRDIGPYKRCVGPAVPKARRFQHPLPEPAEKLSNMNHVAKDLMAFIEKHPDGEFLRLAWQCASTFRATDNQGGCNGASIRFPPGSNWPSNSGLGNTLAMLEPIKQKYGDGLSWSDLIVLAGNVAAELAGSPKLSFCPGRTDAKDGSAWNRIEFGNKDPPSTVEEFLEMAFRRGQTPKDVVALTLPKFGSTRNLKEYVEEDDNGDILQQGLKHYPELRYWVDYYLSEGDASYGLDFANAWTRLMNADRFESSVRNICGGMKS